MVLDLQFQIRNNPNYQKYLRENSHWYKLLNRDPQNFKVFVEEVKDRYQLRPTHRINKMLDTISMVQSIMSTLK